MPVQTTFNADLGEYFLADLSRWSALQNSAQLNVVKGHRIPLPRSNTLAAKAMRIGAMLAALSRSLERHVFQPVYLPVKDGELVRLLRLVQDEDPKGEAHLRATLLSMLPRRQTEEAARRVAAVVHETSSLAQPLLSRRNFEQFRADLKSACRLACVLWMKIQRRRVKLEPNFGPPYDPAHFDWQALMLPGLGQAE